MASERDSAKHAIKKTDSTDPELNAALAEGTALQHLLMVKPIATKRPCVLPNWVDRPRGRRRGERSDCRRHNRSSRWNSGRIPICMDGVSEPEARLI